VIVLNPVLTALAYLVAAVLFILALKGLSSPKTARRGNFLGPSEPYRCGDGFPLERDRQHRVDFGRRRGRLHHRGAGIERCPK